MLSSHNKSSICYTSAAALCLASLEMFDDGYTVPVGHCRLPCFFLLATGPSMALSDSSNIVNGLTPPAALFKLLV